MNAWGAILVADWRLCRPSSGAWFLNPFANTDVAEQGHEEIRDGREGNVRLRVGAPQGRFEGSRQVAFLLPVPYGSTQDKYLSRPIQLAESSV